MNIYMEIEGHDDWRPADDEEEIIRRIIEDGGKDFKDKLCTALEWFISDLEIENHVRIEDDDGHVLWEGHI